MLLMKLIILPLIKLLLHSIFRHHPCCTYKLFQPNSPDDPVFLKFKHRLREHIVLYVGVDSRFFNVDMAKQLRQAIYVHPFLVQVGDKGMPERMW